MVVSAVVISGSRGDWRADCRAKSESMAERTSDLEARNPVENLWCGFLWWVSGGVVRGVLVVLLAVAHDEA